jgi:hypothetical protein
MPGVPGKKPLDNSVWEQPVKVAISNAEMGKIAHLNRGFRGTIDPSIMILFSPILIFLFWPNGHLAQ